MAVGTRTRWYKSKPKRDVDEPGVMVIEPVNDHFFGAFEYRNNPLLKNSSRYDNDVAHELHSMAKNIVVQKRPYVSRGAPDVGNQVPPKIQNGL